MLDFNYLFLSLLVGLMTVNFAVMAYLMKYIIKISTSS